jgi:hypothetical protein
MLPHPSPQANLGKMAIVVVLWPLNLCVLYYPRHIFSLTSGKTENGKRQYSEYIIVGAYCAFKK